MTDTEVLIDGGGVMVEGPSVNVIAQGTQLYRVSVYRFERYEFI